MHCYCISTVNGTYTAILEFQLATISSNEADRPRQQSPSIQLRQLLSQTSDQSMLLRLYVCYHVLRLSNVSSLQCQPGSSCVLQWYLQLVVCGNQNFGSVSVFKKPNRMLFVKPYFTVTAVLCKADFVLFGFQFTPTPSLTIIVTKLTFQVSTHLGHRS